MNPALLAAAAILAATAVAHSLLGERYILARLFRRSDLPRLFGSDLFTRRTLRFAWHITSLAWLGFAGLLIALACRSAMPDGLILGIVAATFAAHAALTGLASRGRHLAWIAFAAVALLAWLPVAKGPTTVTDIDGNRYMVVTLGEQRWLAENLRVTRAPGGEALTTFAPHDDEANVATFGRLYPWEAARRACPAGWQLPSDATWSALESFLGGSAGARLRDAASWPAGTATAADAVAFRARPAGYANDEGFDDFFGSRAVFWTATAQDDHFVWSRVLASDQPDLRRAPQHPQYGFSVRCVRNVSEPSTRRP